MFHLIFGNFDFFSHLREGDERYIGNGLIHQVSKSYMIGKLSPLIEALKWITG